MNLCQPQTSHDIFILDDEEGVRQTLCAILDSGGYKGVCFANDASLLEAIRRHCPAAVMLDVNLPGRSGLEILKDLAAYATPVVMISGSGSISTAVTSMKDGALDFIEKPFKRGDILERLQKIVARFASGNNTSIEQRVSSFNIPGREPLTRRERNVLQLLVTGAPNKQIGEMLGISYRTVEEHRSKIMHKLGLKNIAELLIAVLK